MEVKFTAQMEEELDKIERGRGLARGAQGILRPARQGPQGGRTKVESVKATGIPLDETCPKCGKPLVIKSGKIRPVQGLLRLPRMRLQGQHDQEGGRPARGEMPDLRGPARPARRAGSAGSSPARTTRTANTSRRSSTDTGIACPSACGGTILKRKTRRGKFFYGCSSFPKCRFATWDEPVAKPCPKCGKPFLLQKTSKKEGTYVHCVDEACGYRDPEKPAAPAKKEKAPKGGPAAGPASGAAPEPHRSPPPARAHEKRARRVPRLPQARKGASAHTLAGYRIDLTQLAGHLAERKIRLSEIDNVVLRGFLVELYEKKLTKTSAARKLAAIRSFFEFCVRRKWIDDNPAQVIATPRLDRRVPAFLSEEEIGKLLAAPAVGRRARASATGPSSSSSTPPGSGSASSSGSTSRTSAWTRG